MFHWVKVRIFSFLECWKRHLRDKITKQQNFLLWWNGRCHVKLVNYLKLIAINCTIQPLLLNMNKGNLKVLISDLLFFDCLEFQFDIHLPNYRYGNMLYSLLPVLKCPLNSSSDQQKVSSEL